MSADGVSLPTTLAQMGSVAKAQARATSHPQPATPFADLAEQKGELKARRVQETGQPADNHAVEAASEGLDKRQRRRQRRQGRSADETPEPTDAVADGTASGSSPLGHLVDLRA